MRLFLEVVLTLGQEVAWSGSVSGGGVSQWRQEVAWSGSVFQEVVLASGDRR